MTPVRRCVPRSLLCIALALAFHGAAAQSYPSKPIRFIVGFAPGGPNDTLARLVAARLSETFSVPVTVDNRQGADSIIGTELAARAAPDGYTITMVSASATIHPNVYSKLPYSIMKDFAPVTVLAASNYVVVVNSALPVKTIKELIALARARPGEINFAGSGVGDAIHLAGELFKSMAKINMNFVPYKGGAPAMSDVAGGHVEVMFSPMGLAVPHLQSGKVRALAVTGRTRWHTMPQLPTVAEVGLPGYEVTGWYGVLAPAGTPRPIVDRLNGEIVRTLKVPDVQQKLAGMGLEAVASSPEQMAQHLSAELVKWARVAKSANISGKALF